MKRETGLHEGHVSSALHSKVSLHPHKVPVYGYGLNWMAPLIKSVSVLSFASVPKVQLAFLFSPSYNVENFYYSSFLLSLFT